MLLDGLKKEKIEAMKQRNADAVTALNAVISKLMLVTIDKREKGKELDELDVIAVLQKTEKELIEEQTAFQKAGRADTVAALERQLQTVRKYLPKLLSSQEIRDIIAALADKSVPAVMKHFKTEYAGKVDMKTVSDVLKTFN